MLINKSKTYLTYYLNEFVPVKYLNKFLINTYLAYEDDTSKFCMLYEFSGKKEFTDYEYSLENSDYFYKTVDVNKKQVLYVFNIPEELDDVINLFKNGKYGELPEKNLLIKFLMYNYRINASHDIIRIINRDPTLRKQMEDELNELIPEDQDLSSLPDMNNENFKISKFNA